jgi:hypothetical protein
MSYVLSVLHSSWSLTSDSSYSILFSWISHASSCSSLLFFYSSNSDACSLSLLSCYLIVHASLFNPNLESLSSNVLPFHCFFDFFSSSSLVYLRSFMVCVISLIFCAISFLLWILSFASSKVYYILWYHSESLMFVPLVSPIITCPWFSCGN